MPAHGCIKTRAVRIATQILERAGWLTITFVKRCLKLVSLTPIGEQYLKEGMAGDVRQKTVDDLKHALEAVIVKIEAEMPDYIDTSTRLDHA